MLKFYPAEMLKRQSVQASAVKKDVRAYLEDVFSNLSKEEFSTIFLETVGCLHEEPNYRIEHPLVLVHGEHDGTGNIKKGAQRWAAREPHCQYIVLPDAGHCANQDNPEFSNTILLNFCKEFSSNE